MMHKSPAIHAAFFLYLVSYCLPAIVIAGDRLFGFSAAWLAFIGAISWDLEDGQTPACLLGALANILMVGGYVGYNLRRFSKRVRPYCSIASRLAGVAATCAFGSVIFLASGSESFVPHIGCFVWLASMILMSFACWKMAKADQCEQNGVSNGAPAKVS